MTVFHSTAARSDPNLRGNTFKVFKISRYIRSIFLLFFIMDKLRPHVTTRGFKILTLSGSFLYLHVLLRSSKPTQGMVVRLRLFCLCCLM
jgi:hypothetical protein